MFDAQSLKAAVKVGSIYAFECYDRDGNLKWTETVHNLVTDAGLDDLLSKYFKGSSYTAAFYAGLKSTGTPSAADTLASHVSWTEITGYTGNRQTLVLGSVTGQSVDNLASKAVFPITADATIAGAFVASVASGTSGVLYGVANFSTSRDLKIDDDLKLTITLLAESA